MLLSYYSTKRLHSQKSMSSSLKMVDYFYSFRHLYQILLVAGFLSPQPKAKDGLY